MEDLFLSEVSKLNENQQILLKDTILHGEWGDCDMEFLDENGDTETDRCYGFITNDAKEGGHFSGRQVSGMFRHIIKKICPNNGIGRVFCHCHDWWEDGSGDVLFIRKSAYDVAWAWAEGKEI